MAGSIGVQDLLDRAAITEVQMDYARGIDRRDWQRYRSIFADEVAFDFTSWSGVQRTFAADDWVARVRGNLSGFDATQHVMTNLQFERVAEGMICTVQMMAIHHLVVDGDRRFQIIGGYYTNHFRDHAEGWKIDRCQLTVCWEKGDRHLFVLAKQRWDERTGG